MGPAKGEGGQRGRTGTGDRGVAPTVPGVAAAGCLGAPALSLQPRNLILFRDTLLKKFNKLEILFVLLKF